MNLSRVQPLSKVVVPNSLVLVTFPGSSSFLRKLNRDLRSFEVGSPAVKWRGRIVCAGGGLFPVDPWAPPNIDSKSIASQLSAFSLIPYIGFLYFITKSKSSPKLTIFGFYFLLAFVGATIPAGIYGKFSSLNNNYFQVPTLIHQYYFAHGCQIVNLLVVMTAKELIEGAVSGVRSNAESSIQSPSVKRLIYTASLIAASPEMIEAVVSGVRSIAESCIQSATVKRLIYTATSMAASPITKDGKLDFKSNINELCWTPVDITLTHGLDYMMTYTISKTLAEKEALSYNDKPNCKLEVVSLPLGLVGGETLLSYVPLSVQVMLSQLIGNSETFKALQFQQQLLGSILTVHIDDVCDAHIFCIEKPSLRVVPNSPVLVPFPGSSSFLRNLRPNPSKLNRVLRNYKDGNPGIKRKGGIVCAAGGFLPVDPWAPNIDSQSIASQLFAFSLFPYIGFLYFITKSKSSPKLTLFGFYFLLAFVGATIPAGIYAKVKYGTSLSNVDWLHGGAESLLTLTNLFIVVGLRQALRRTEDAKESTSSSVPEVKDQK
ncbi:hypothetical protein CCACVL1_13476 [Corchorus capsularis]|uniref:Uncharacterized protein n=1 Tax=Corchorus capsularis TaxID=210143 RepID=A0A1R3IAZ6_COCAP|nr:hypothetical protein CCACVL1_13476 [Corchorus capsularis]